MAVVVTVTALATRYRAWNFDCIGYSVAAWHWLGAEQSELHGRVYGELASVAPREALNALVAGSGYRRTLSTLASALFAQVPFYENKPVYVALIAQAARWGANTHLTAFFISAISAGLLLALFLTEVARVSNAYAAAVLAALVGLSAPFRAVATEATPDALFALLAFGCVTVVLRRGTGSLVALLAVACALTRPDGVPFVLALLAVRAVESKKWLPSAVTALAALGAACLAFARGYAWKALIVHTFVRRVVERSAADSAHFTVSDYAKIVQEGLSGRNTPDRTVAPLIALFTIVVVLVSRKKPHPRRASLLLWLLLTWTTVVVHFLVFPLFADRFFIASYLTCIALGLELLRDRYGPRRTTPGSWFEDDPAGRSAGA